MLGLADFQHIVPSTDTTVQLKKALLKGDGKKKKKSFVSVTIKC